MKVIRRASLREPKRPGAALVEFAVILPLFLLLLGGIIEFGQAFRISHGLSNAARRAARAAIMDKATASHVTAIAENQCESMLGVNSADATVTITLNGQPTGSLTSAVQGDAIGVTVSIPFQKAGAGFYCNLFSEKNLSSTCVLERE